MIYWTEGAHMTSSLNFVFKIFSHSNDSECVWVGENVNERNLFMKPQYTVHKAQ